MEKLHSNTYVSFACTCVSYFILLIRLLLWHTPLRQIPVVCNIRGNNNVQRRERTDSREWENGHFGTAADLMTSPRQLVLLVSKPCEG